MNLPVPVVGGEPGPQYAQDVNNSLGIIDQHNHSNGSGVQITPNGLNINASLPFNNNLATALAGLTLVAQASAAPINTIYESGVDLYYVDGLGNNIQITKSGSLAGTPGSIANLASPASVTYVSASQTFVFQSNTNISANLDAASILMRNISPNSTNALTLQPPAALGSNYAITLPSLPPGQQIMTLDNSGNMAAPYTVDGATVIINSNVIEVGTVQLANMAANSVGTTQLVNNSVTNTKLAPLNYAISASCGLYSSGFVGVTQIPNLFATITTSGRPVKIEVIADGSKNADFGATNGGASLYFLRDAALVGIYSLSSFQSSGVVGPTSAVSFVDFPAAGTYTYYLQHDSASPVFTFHYSKLLVYEL
jgi:hypothetical protein